MKRLKTILTATLLTLTAHAGWKPLKTLEHYGPKAFTLKEGVRYVELRKHTRYLPMPQRPREVVKASIKVSSALRIYKYTPSNKRIFARMPMTKRAGFKKGEEGGLWGSSSWYYNGFMLDSAGKTWRLENTKDVIDMVKPIDTPAEISLVLWLSGGKGEHGSNYSAKYRKSGKGYIVREHFVIEDNAYGCGDYSYQYTISRSGKIRQKKLLRKRAAKVCGTD